MHAKRVIARKLKYLYKREPMPPSDGPQSEEVSSEQQASSESSDKLLNILLGVGIRLLIIIIII